MWNEWKGVRVEAWRVEGVGCGGWRVEGGGCGVWRVSWVEGFKG